MRKSPQTPSNVVYGIIWIRHWNIVRYVIPTPSVPLYLWRPNVVEHNIIYNAVTHNEQTCFSYYSPNVYVKRIESNVVWQRTKTGATFGGREQEAMAPPKIFYCIVDIFYSVIESTCTNILYTYYERVLSMYIHDVTIYGDFTEGSKGTGSPRPSTVTHIWV